MPGNLLNTGTLRIHLVVYLGETNVLDLEDLLVFEVHDASDMRGLYHGVWPGAVRLNLPWTTEQIGAPPGSPTAGTQIFPN